jgi:hypothetical protein
MAVVHALIVCQEREIICKPPAAGPTAFVVEGLPVKV